MKRMECDGDEDETEGDAAELEHVAQDKARAEKDDSRLEPELIGRDAGAEDTGKADGVGDEDAEEDGPEDVLDIGEGEVVGLRVGVDGVFGGLAGVADEGKESDAGQKRGKRSGLIGEAGGAEIASGGRGGHGLFLDRWRDYQGMVLMRPRRIMRARVSERATAQASRERVRRGVMEFSCGESTNRGCKGTLWWASKGVERD